MKIWKYLAMAFGFVAMLFKVLLSKSQRDAAVKEAKQSETARKASEDATEALVRGLNEEAKPIMRNGRRLK